jgi:hypothetical protein
MWYNLRFEDTKESTRCCGKAGVYDKFEDMVNIQIYNDPKLSKHNICFQYYRSIILWFRYSGTDNYSTDYVQLKQLKSSVADPNPDPNPRGSELF